MNFIEVAQELNKVMNEGMWASPFYSTEVADEVVALLSKPITFSELNSEEVQNDLWNVIGDDKFWDGVASMANDFPDNDARYFICEFLRDWMEHKEDFRYGKYSDEAAEKISKAIEPLMESLKDYKEVAKIIQNKEDGGFNVAEGNDPMLIKDRPSIKDLLNELAKYL